MIRAEDVKSGYGQRRTKAPNPLIPFLRARQAEKAEAGKQPASPKTDKKVETIEEGLG